MPNVRNIGNQSEIRDGRSAGRIVLAFNPSAVSCRPRRRNQPATQSSTLATKGILQPHTATWLLLSEAFTSHADPEPRMKPSVTPAAVELLIRPRANGDADSVVYTIEPVNSPPTENPCI